jgi:ankyrin repeat protein
MLGVRHVEELVRLQAPQMSHLKAASTASKESTAIVQPRSMSASTTSQTTSLREAIKREQYDVFDKLINIPDVDPNELDREGRTPLIRIVQEGRPEFYLHRICSTRPLISMPEMVGWIKSLGSYTQSSFRLP